jgi:hypothetical protein
MSSSVARAKAKNKDANVMMPGTVTPASEMQD